MNIRFCCIAAAVMVSANVPPAHAQTFLKENVGKMIRKVGVHGNVGFRHPIDSDVTKGRSLGASLGLSPGKTNGFKYPVGLSWYSEGLHAPGGEQFGIFRTISLLAGVGYGWHFGRFSTGVALQGGYSFNHVRPDGDVLRAFGIPEGTVTLDVKNSFVVRPQVTVEYFLTPKFTIRGSGDYVRLQPDISVTTPNQRFDGQWDASSVHANIGVGFYPFRK